MTSQFFTKSNIAFACKFFGFSFLFVLAFDYIPMLSEREDWTRLLASASCGIIQSVTPAENCTRNNSTLLSNKTPVVIITKECDGINALILLSAAILSFPTIFRFKIIGIAIGSVILVFCNILRITSLYYISKHYTPYFDVIHTMVAPMATIMPTVIFYFIWLTRTKRHDLEK